MRTKCANTRGLCFVAQGEWAAAEREFREALQSAEQRGDVRLVRLVAHNLGTPAGMRGDFGVALRWLRRMLRDEANSDLPPMPQEATAHLNMARCHLYRGDFALCEQHLDQALESCQKFNLLSLRGEIFEAYANFYRKQDDRTRATEYYDRAARAYEESNIDATRHELPEERAVLALQTGDVEKALLLINHLIDARRSINDEIGIHTALLIRGRIHIVKSDTSAGEADLEPALQYFEAHNLYYYEAQTRFALAICADRRKDEQRAISHLRRALDLAVRYDYDYWLRREVTRLPELFLSQEAFSLLPADLREEVSRVQVETAKSPTHTRAVAPFITSINETQVRADLTINLLGPVEIYRDRAKPFAPDAWITKRAREILCFIVSRAHRRAAKDVIKDMFWAESDAGVIEKNFHPTISHIRKALNSHQPLKQNFLLYRDGDYMLNPEFTYTIDSEEFDRLIREGERGERARSKTDFVPLYERAVALYRGEFMSGVYDNWTSELRTYYREQYLRILKALADSAAADENWTRTLDLTHKILQEDPFQEEVHCLAMRGHAALGNRNAVNEQYENLRRLLRKELAIEPSAETRRIVRELVS